MMEGVSVRIADLQKHLAAVKARFSVPIVCLCGSTRFKQAWIDWNARLTRKGEIVLAVGLWGHHERIEPTAEEKDFLDTLHYRKIDLCDRVFVLDVGGYIGESTRREIAYAEKVGRPVTYLSHEFPNYVEPCDLVAKERDEVAVLLGSLLNETAYALPHVPYNMSRQALEMAMCASHKWLAAFYAAKNPRLDPEYPGDKMVVGENEEGT
jgi:hypothetical protein